HSEKEKISHDTRMKVIETAKRMGYVPNNTTKVRAKNQSNLIGVVVNLSRSASSYMKYQSLDLASELQKQIYAAGYDTLLSIAYELEDIQIKYKHSLEAAFIIDVNEKSLKRITTHYYVPLIFMDCDFEEGLFYKILPDYKSLLQTAEAALGDPHPFLVMDQTINECIKEQITDNFAKEDIFLYRNNANLKEFLEQKISRKGIIIGDLLGVQVERYLDNRDIIVISSNNATDLLLPDTRRITVSNRQKAEVGMKTLHNLLHLDYDETAKTRILLLPDASA
ncbi:MAG: hypothetical protein WBI07_04630, partial [Mobilitalea sp.]